ncbi:hypothetical protein HYALB_00005066 [Hymenoscyphus albidus]|uniref:Uncharacterized protein n=1 Tax=Hymenoscyphus albidus TaxID=595503 RepID=A0A9N9LTS9_9HELO|nr:hypothetical protein HYALB_00005066 [Hymenoscyphus albidus]
MFSLTAVVVGNKGVLLAVLLAVLLPVLLLVLLSVLGGPPGKNGSAPPPDVPDDLDDELEVEFPRGRDDGLPDAAELEEVLLKVGRLVGRDPDAGTVEFPRVRDADLVGTLEVFKEPVPKGTGIFSGPFVLVDLVPDDADVELDRRLLDDTPLDLDIVGLPVLVLKVGFLEETVEFLLGEKVPGLAGVELVLDCVG